MRKLLSAEAMRLFHSVIFHLALLYSAGLGVVIVFMRWLDVRRNAVYYAGLSAQYSNADGLVFVGGLYITFAIAVFIGIFIGTESSDGTIRNKLVVGHRRWKIYLSEWIVCTAASLLFHLSYILVTLGMGKLLLGLTLSMKEIFLFTAAGSAAIIALTSVLLLLAIALQNKAVGSVVCLLLIIASIFLTLTIFLKLEEPEFTRARTIEDEITGTVMEIPAERNPYYLSGTVRQVYQVLNDALPVSQLYQVVMMESENIPKMMLWDAVLIVLSTGIGVPIFKRKNLK